MAPAVKAVRLALVSEMIRRIHFGTTQLVRGRDSRAGGRSFIERADDGIGEQRWLDDGGFCWEQGSVRRQN